MLPDKGDARGGINGIATRLPEGYGRADGGNRQRLARWRDGVGRSRDAARQGGAHAEPAIINADAVRLEQIVGNLLANALKFTDPAGTIRVAARTEGRQGGAARAG
jgi:signal transduction histidine kinase